MKYSDELSSFEIKASAYRQALSSFPNARILEVLPFIYQLERICERLSIQRSKLLIVDLMSGSGFLSEKLYSFGFTRIVAFEACNQMSFGSPIYNKVELKACPDIEQALQKISELEPHAVISLASFHHLIEYDSFGKVDTAKSNKLQIRVLESCFRSLREGGCIMICDLAELSFPCKKEETAYKNWVNHNSIVKDYFSNYFSVLKGKLDLTSTYGSLTNSIKQVFALNCEGKRYSLDWFREVVDKETTLGHKDASLSKSTLEFSNDVHDSGFNLISGVFPCPWLFDSRMQLEDFIYSKFGFKLNTGNLKIESSQVMKIAEKRSMIGNINSLYYFKWELGYLSMLKPMTKIHNNDVQTANILLVGMNLVLIAALIGKLTTGLDPIGSGFLLQSLGGFFLGSILTLSANNLKKALSR